METDTPDLDATADVAEAEATEVETTEATAEEAHKPIDIEQLKRVLEAALFAIHRPMSLKQLAKLFARHERPDVKVIREVLKELQADYEGHSIELKEVGSGFRFQVKSDYNKYVGKMWEEKAPRYSRAAMETLALVVYRQPITRAEVEDVRGVAVSTNIIRALEDRGWVHVVGHKDVPGRPALFATTKKFLDDFNLKSLTELPTLDDLKDFDQIEEMFKDQLDLLKQDAAPASNEQISEEEALPSLDEDVEVEAELDEAV